MSVDWVVGDRKHRVAPAGATRCFIFVHKKAPVRLERGEVFS